ncbi:MAG: hypothetical protein KDD62_10185 [Bdellovibrionales bacterium]|nr:hypothetical protein [Bdellovibrionales bacterium]
MYDEYSELSNTILSRSPDGPVLEMARADVEFFKVLLELSPKVCRELQNGLSPDLIAQLKKLLSSSEQLREVASMRDQAKVRVVELYKKENTRTHFKTL